MSLLVAVVTRDSTYVLFVFSSLSTPLNLGRVDSGDRGGRLFGFPGIPLFWPVLLLLILFALIRGLEIFSGRGGSGCGTLRSLGVIPAIHHPLRLDLMSGDMGRSVPSEIAQISLPHIETRA